MKRKLLRLLTAAAFVLFLCVTSVAQAFDVSGLQGGKVLAKSDQDFALQKFDAEPLFGSRLAGKQLALAVIEPPPEEGRLTGLFIVLRVGKESLSTSPKNRNNTGLLMIPVSLVSIALSEDRTLRWDTKLQKYVVSIYGMDALKVEATLKEAQKP